MATLEYLIDEQQYVANLDADENAVGRAKECRLQLLHDPELSRVHCIFRRRADSSYVLVDEGSTNGTYLNEERVGNAELPLREGDRIRIGTTVLVFREQQPGRTTMLFTEVEQQMKRGEGFHTIMGKILQRRKKP
jgi:pSer/pThr/pTyr-binding forkhead associated (FHA) protein